MKEKDFNKIVKDSIIARGGFAYKISDSSGNSGQKRPFDGFGVLKNRNIYWEGKLSQGYKAFNLKEVFEGSRGHQMTTMDIFYKLTPESDLWVPYMCYFPRDSKVFLFSYKALRELYWEYKITSIHSNVLKNLHSDVIKKEGKDRIIIGDLKPITTEEILNSIKEICLNDHS